MPAGSTATVASPKANAAKPPAVEIKAQAPAPASTQAPKITIKAESLEEIKAHWNELTHEVSLRKMAVATYLQDGRPCEFKAGRLVIGFSKENTFAKESLNTKENLKFIEDLFSEKLNASSSIQFTILDHVTHEVKHEESVVRSALEMFGGKVVKEWPNAQKLPNGPSF